MFSRSDEPEHRKLFRESVIDFTEREATLESTRSVLAMSNAHSQQRWKAMADLGWTSLLVPEDLGGLGMDCEDLAALYQEVGRGALPEPLITIPLLVAQALVHGGNSKHKETVMPELLSGDRMATLAWQGTPGALGADGVGPLAQQNGTGWTLSGQADFVQHAAMADSYIVAAKASDGVLLAWVDAAPSIIGTALQVDGTSNATVDLDGLSVQASDVIASPSEGPAILEHVLDIARLGIVAQLQGLMEQAFQLTLDYIKQREQFGKPIASFQTIQHRVVDLYTQIEMANSALGRAARACCDPSNDTERSQQISAAKCRAGSAAQAVVKECIQFHGAIGYTDEYDLSLFVNRVLVLSTQLGNPRVHRERWFKLRASAMEANA
ncbi:acyl-CoA dehydrogenase family protein [Sedimentitalea sp.]|uniref:acyl-CoA dehydrogenase family protein n=1 Tax=Sedimentitalea sp. TaxID=2048915 RepID=UPI0032980A2C